MRRRKTGLVCGMWLVAALFALSNVFIGCGGGGDSTSPVTVPGAPSNLIANAGDNSVTLSWSPVAGATSYNSYRGTTPGVTKATGTKVSGVQSPNIVAGLANGTPYYFVVTAVNAAGESVESAEKTATPSATPPPIAPANVRATAGDNQVTISWDAVGGATSYNIYRGTSSEVTKATGTQTAGVTSPSVVAGLTNGTAYFFVVTAVNANGESAESFEVSATPAATPPPAAPVGVSATPGDAQASVSWSAVAGATSYNLYWATTTGVTKATGTKVSGVQSPNVVAGLTNGTPYYFVVTAVNAAGESVESAEVSATPVAPGAGFSQADATGTWDGVQFSMGSESGWARMGANINGSGAVTATYVLDSTGNTSLPPPGSITWTVSGTGVVTESGPSGSASFHGQLSSNKLLVIGTSGATGPTARLSVFRKRTGTTFSSADLANKTFTYHLLLTGADNTWERGAGTTNASSAVTLTSIVTPSGDQTPPPGEVGTFAVSAEGIVTNTGGSTWYGLLTDDKKVIFVIQTRDIGVYDFMVITITGQTYVQSDLAGTYNFSGFRNTVPRPAWSYGAFSVDTAGNGVYLSYTDNFGNPVPGSFFLSLSASGITTSPADASHHGQLSYNKDLFVRTNTNAAGRYGLSISFK